MELDNIKIIADIIQAITTSLGIILAGAWSLWLFFFSRTFAGTLVISLKLTDVTTVNNIPVAIVNVEIKNIGRTRVKKGYCLIVAKPVEDPLLQEGVSVIGTQTLDYIEARTIFNSLVEIEPNETVSDELALVLNKISFFKVGIKFRRLGTSETWESTAVFNVANKTKTLAIALP